MSRKDNLKAIAFAAKKKTSETNRAAADSFSSKQSQYARRSEEDQVREQQESKFATAQPRSAPSTSTMGFRAAPAKRGKFALSEGGTAASSGGGSALGSTVSRLPAAAADDDEQTVKTRRERFQDMMLRSKQTKADDRRRRDDQDKTTQALDSDFAGLMHLMQKRDKRQEDVDAFLRSGRPEVRKMLAEHAASRSASGSGARRFRITSSGDMEAEDAPAAAAEMTADAQRLLEQTRRGQEAPPALDTKAPVPEPEEAEEEDAFDKMMGTFRLETKMAHATDREYTAEEIEARRLADEVLQVDRAARPTVDVDKQTTEVRNLDRLEHGGDEVYRMGSDDDEDAAPDTKKARAAAKAKAESVGAHPVDQALADLEALLGDEDVPEMSANERSARLTGGISQLWEVARLHSKHATEFFQMILLDVQKDVYKGRTLKPFSVLSLYVATKLFPVTDYRHPVTTPLLLLLASLVGQAKLTDRKSVAQALFFGATLASALAPGEKYTSEPVVLALNVLALALPRKVLQPAAHRSVTVPFPILQRPEPAMLAAKADDDVTALSLFDHVLGGATPSDAALLAAAYRLLGDCAAVHPENPGFPCAFGELFLDGLEPHMAKAVAAMPKALRAVHDEVATRVKNTVEGVEGSRAPLAMRTFRPRPLRMFEPLLGSDETSDRRMERTLKKELREDKKRVIRHVTAEATVDRRTRERDADADASRRATKLREVMGELQQQQFIMKTADTLRDKAKSKKRGRVNEGGHDGGKEAGGGGGGGGDE